jgi:hypothetical protein
MITFDSLLDIMKGLKIIFGLYEFGFMFYLLSP